MTAENKELVLRFYDELFSVGSREVIEKYVGDTYTNHNPQGVDGPEGIFRFITWFRATFPEMHKTVERVIAEDDLVLLHTRSVLAPGAPTQAVIDIYRVEGGKIVEHWDVIQPVPEAAASGHDMFATISEPAQNLPDPAAPTADSKRVVLALFHELAVDRDPAAIERYATGPFYEHNAKRSDGVEVSTAMFVSAFAEHPELSISIKRVIAEGDYVAVHHHFQADADDRGAAAIEIFRVQDGKLVEHWDTVQPVPETSANDNTMF